jgi:hypothetical protein
MGIRVAHLVVLVTLAHAQLTGQPLRLRADGTFNIMLVADVHTGEGEASWGPGVDAHTYRDLGAVVAAEGRAGLDLAIFSGDMLTGLNVDANATAYWDRLVQVFDAAAIPHTAILGNHDAEPFSGSGANQSAPGAKTNRTQLMQHDAALPLSYSQAGPAHLRPAVSVYVVDVFPRAPSPGERPVLQLYHLDSGGGGMPEEVYAAQVTWFNDTVKARRKAHSEQNSTIVPALVFIHIPLWEFQDAVATPAKHSCFGDHDDGITPTVSNTGLFAALDAAPEVQAVFVGHDHCNDFCCQFGKRAVDLCFGRHSGYGGYSCDGYDTGSRVISFDADTRVIETHVRMNSNLSVVHQGRLVEAMTLY